jgi:tetratricopeptide (TPR) repeat protein
MEQARLEREARVRAQAEARKKERDARAAGLAALEAAGDEAARKGDLDGALARYAELLGKVLRYGEQDQRVRLSVIKVVRSMAAPPPIPEEALRYMVRGEAKVKAGGAGSYEGAAREMEKAVALAPWFADGYYNLAAVQEKAGRFGRAIQDLRLYLAAAPDAPNAGAAKAKAFALEVDEEEAAKVLFLAGQWRNTSGKEGAVWDVDLRDGKLQIGGFIQAEKKGNALEGFADLKGFTEHNCPVPAQRKPVQGTVSADGRSMELRFDIDNYYITWQGNVCTGVTLTGKIPSVNRLERISGCRFCGGWETLTPDKAAAAGAAGATGVLVTAVGAGGPADRAGIRVGDAITAFQGMDAVDDKTLSGLSSALPVGSEVWLSILRDGIPHDVTFRTGVAVGR